MLEHLMEGTDRRKVSLDDADNRRLAKTDPSLFLEMHPVPVLIEEVQYAPELFTYIKIKVDNGAVPGSYWLTGSQVFQLMELVKESLAGRTAIVHMSALSQSELYGDGATEPLSLRLDKLNKRKDHLSGCTAIEMYERIWNGGMPGHRSGKYRDKDTNENDMVMETDGELHPLEIKKNANPGTELASAFKVIDKGGLSGTGAILCLREELSAIDRNTFLPNMDDLSQINVKEYIL